MNHMKSKTNLLILSILLVLMAIPALKIGYLSIKTDSFTCSLTLMHIPVIIAAIFYGLHGAVITGSIFGLATFINAFGNRAGILSPCLKNPLCSILPCIIFALCVYYIFTFLEKRKLMKSPLNAISTSFICSLLHSIFMTASMYIFMYKTITEIMHGINWFKLMQILFPQIILEAIAALILVAFVYLFIFLFKLKFKKRNSLARH